MHTLLQRRRSSTEEPAVQPLQESTSSHLPVQETPAPLEPAQEEAQTVLEMPEIQRAQPYQFSILPAGAPPPPNDGPVTIQPSLPDLRYGLVVPVQRADHASSRLMTGTVLQRPVPVTIQRSSDLLPIQRQREKLQNDQLTLLVDVDDTLLDEGSKLLKKLVRPPKVNDAGADKLSNCALTTLAAIEAGKTSGGVAGKVRTGASVSTTTVQSEKLWALTLADAETLAKSGMAVSGTSPQSVPVVTTPSTGGTIPTGATATPASSSGGLLGGLGGFALKSVKKPVAPPNPNVDLIKNLENFSEGGAFVIGDAQYYGMLNYLISLAAEQATPDVNFKVFECGEPGNVMFPETELLAKMNSYPNGTRFAVFVFSSNTGQHVRQHWVYAQRFNGNTIFQDYQVNTSLTNKVDSYLNQFPFSPDVAKDKGMSFEKGAFVAYVPVFTGQTLPTLPGTEVNADTVQRILGEVRGKMGALKEQITAPGETFSDSWPALGSTILTEIPAPSKIQQAIEHVGNQLGTSPHCAFGSLTGAGKIRVLGQPVHSHGTQRVSKSGSFVDVESDVLTFQPATTTMGVVQPGTPGSKPDTAEVPATTSVGPSSERSYREAFAKAYQISAQTTESFIEINALNAEFTDVIHEATHTFEAATLPMHLREGLCEVFAAMATEYIRKTNKDERFKYSYNQTYAHYTAAMHQLIRLLGLGSMAQLYFGAQDHRAYLVKTIRHLQSGLDETTAGGIADKLLDFDSFPTAFKEGLTDLAAAKLGTAPSAALPLDTATPLSAGQKKKARQKAGAIKSEVYDASAAQFGGFLSKERTRIESERKVKLTGDSLDVAVEVDRWAGTDTAEKRLRLLYKQREAAKGQQFVELMKLIDGHENAISAATGEDKEKIRERILPKVSVTFQVQHAVPKGAEVFLIGEAAQVGKWEETRAVKMQTSGSDLWTATVSIPATGTALSYRYFVKSGTGVTGEGTGGQLHTHVLPSTSTGKTFTDTWASF